MAIDSERKRWGMLQLASGPSFYPLVFNPDTSGVDATERATLLKLYGGIAFQGEVFATTITVSAITGGEDLTSLSYVVFDAADIGSASIIKQANDESTDNNGDLVIDLSSLSVSVGTTLTIIITNYTTAPTATNRAAVCFANAA